MRIMLPNPGRDFQVDSFNYEAYAAVSVGAESKQD